MMNTIKISIENITEELQDIIIAEFNLIGFHGFEQSANELIAYVSEDLEKEELYFDILNKYNLTLKREHIEPINWNKEWESNFEPVIVPGICTIRADFHDINVYTPYEIIITPKMSFGTGHHATTKLMIKMMSNINIEEKSVLDFGTGSGILAILASKLGSNRIVAIDNDQWSIDNATENAERNGVDIHFILGSIDFTTDLHFNIILANINRHILLEYMQLMYESLNENGILLMSGLLVDDEKIIVEAAENVGFTFNKMFEENGWIAIEMLKIEKLS